MAQFSRLVIVLLGILLGVCGQSYTSHFYYYTNGHLRRWDGTSVTNIFTHAASLQSNVVYDTTNSRLVFRDAPGYNSATAGIYSCDLNGNNLRLLLVDGNTNGNVDLAIDNVNGFIYYYRLGVGIRRMNLGIFANELRR
jgi:hypothetical protein